LVLKVRRAPEAVFAKTYDMDFRSMTAWGRRGVRQRGHEPWDLDNLLTPSSTNSWDDVEARDVHDEDRVTHWGCDHLSNPSHPADAIVLSGAAIRDLIRIEPLLFGEMGRGGVQISFRTRRDSSPQGPVDGIAREATVGVA
jgi:hypothetical protein